MRVLFICPNLQVGGAERHWSLLIPSLAARGFTVSVLALDGEGPFAADLRSSGIDVHCAWMRSRYDLVSLRRALAAVWNDPDVVVSRSVSAIVVGHLLARRSGARHFANEHTEYDLVRTHQRLLLRLFAPRVDGVIAVSQAQRERLQRHGYRRARIHVVPNGVPADDLRTGRPRGATRQALGFGDHDFVACLVATLRAEKRGCDFVTGIGRAHACNPGIRGLIVGGGPELERVRATAEAADGIVRVLGERLDVPELLDAADVVCLTSVYETMPVSLLEGMAHGCPVIATDVGGNAEVVQHGRTGLLVPPLDAAAFANALLDLAADDERVAHMGREALALHRERFDLERMVDGYESILCGVGNGPVRQTRSTQGESVAAQ
jgi:glycosyltransferase involved in cell wall biosynthesis